MKIASPQSRQRLTNPSPSGLHTFSSLEVSRDYLALNTNNLVFIDAKVEDSAILLEGLLPGYQGFILADGQDGVQQITDLLSEFGSTVKGLHIVAHGSTAGLQLGTTALHAGTLERYVPTFERWSQYLAPKAQIALYSCCVAEGAQGQAFIRSLYEITGLAIAASSTPIGHASAGGNWDLDVYMGQFTPVVAFDSKTVENYQHTLTVEQAFNGITPVDPVDPNQTGAVQITVKPGANIQTSTFNDKSFTVENTGDKRIAAIYIDLTDALFPDTVYDPIGIAGDSAFRGLTFNSTGGTGAFEPSGADVLAPFFGTGGTAGYEGMLLTFDPSTDGGYDPGEIIKFGVDIDPNSSLGLPKNPVDINGNDPRINAWDIAGVSGAELINSKVHVLFTDGTTAVGELMGDGSQGGSVAVVSQASLDKQATLTVNGLGEGAAGSYSQSNIQVLVSGDAGDTARIVLAKGFIQPFDYIDPDGNPVNVSALFAGSPFPANNAIQFQTVDVLLDGTVQDITSLFDFGSPGGNLAFSGDDRLPLGFAASIIDANELPLGPVTEPIYLVHTDAGSTNTAPITTGIANVTVTEGADDTVISLFDAFADVETADADLTYVVTGNTNNALFDGITIDPVTGNLTLDYAAAGIGSSDITVSATDLDGLSVDTTFTVTVNDPAANTTPTSSGIANVVVTEGAADTTISLFDAFADAETADVDLSYAVTGNTNSALFDGVTIDEVTGNLTLDYTATGIGSSDVTVSATDAGGLSVDTTFTVTVNEAVPPPPPGRSIRIEAEDYKAGTNGVEFFDTGSSNVGGAYRPDEPVDIQATQDVGGGFNIGWTAPGEFLTYDIDVPEAGVYDISFRVASNKSNRSFTVTAGSQSYTATFDSTGGTQSWQDVVIQDVTLSAGLQELRVEMNTNKINFNYFELIPTGPDETAPTAALNAATLDLPLNSTADALITIDYSDNVAVESDTLDSQDIQVLAPDGTTILATSFVSANPAGDNQLSTVTYAIAAPSGGWQLSDSGTYTINVLADQVLDTNANPVAPQQFDLAVTVSEPPPNTAPTTSGIANVTVAEGASDTIISLFDAFEDAQNLDAELIYEVVANTNPALVATSPTIDSATGELILDYAATGLGTADITVRATDTGNLSVDTTFTVTVNEAPPLPPGSVISRIEAEDYIGFSDSSVGNQGGVYRSDDVDLQATQDEGGGFNVGWIVGGEFLTYNLDVPESGIYDIAVRVASNKSNRSFTVTVDGQSYDVTFDSTGGFQSWQDVVIPGVSLNAGTQELRMDMNTGGFNFNYLELISTIPDETAPTATLNSASLELPIDSTADAFFTVNYSDNVAIESDTLDSQDIQVLAPDGTTVLTTSFFSANPTGDSASPTVTYAIAAPVGGWQFSDNGTYTVNILSDQVLDTSGNALLPQQFNLDITVSDPPVTAGVPDIVVLEGASDSTVDLFATFEDPQDTDADLTYTVLNNTNPGLVSTAIVGGTLTLDYATTGTGAADITLQATDTDGGSTETTFTVTAVNPLPSDDVIRINTGGGNVYDDLGNLFLADTFFTSGQAVDVPNDRAIVDTKYDELYLTQRQGSSFSYSIPVTNGFYLLNAHIVDWESTDVDQRIFDITVEDQSFYDDLDIYDEIKNAFLDGKDTAKIIQGPDKDTTIIANVSDGSLDIDFAASVSDATIAALEVIPLNQPGVLIQETPVGDPSTIVSEDEMVDSYTVVLTTPPTGGDVTVNLLFDSAQLSTNVPSVTFNATNWNQPQTINISAVDDVLEEGPATEVISHTLSLPVGSNYEGITADSVTVDIIDNDATAPISFTQSLIATTNSPTTGAIGPDGRLYVAGLLGDITVYTLNDDYTIDPAQTEVIDIIGNLSNKNITGIAFNPYDTEPKIYVSHNQFYANKGKAFPATEFSPYSGQVSILEKVNGTWELTPLVTGIGVSNHDHGVNGLEFDNNGDLYITVGSNTNAGVGDPDIGGIDESPFTAAILKAEITKPDFNGAIDYTLIDIPTDLAQPVPQEFLDGLPPEILNPPADLAFDPADSQFWGGYVDVVPGVDVSVYASGFRNPYDLTLTTQGLLYATENNANAGFGDVSTGAYTQEEFGQGQPEELNLVVEGNYYGSPNRNRGRTDARQNIYFDSPVDLPAEGYTAPIGTFQGSTNGITEYRATAFGGQLRGNLIAQKWKGKLYSVDLTSDGQQVESIVDLNKVANLSGGTPDGSNTVARGLDVITGPGGAIIGIDFKRDELTVAIPTDDPSITDPTAYDIYPWRAPVQGGTNFIIGGVNFDTDPGDTRVFIGDQEATAIEVTGITVSETRINGVVPDLSTQPDHLLDIFIKDAAGTVVSTIDDAFLPLVG